MFSKLTRYTLVLVGAAALALGGSSATVSGSEGEDSATAGSCVQQDLTEAVADQSVMACGSTCYGPCKTCVLGVCEDTCH